MAEYNYRTRFHDKVEPWVKKLKEFDVNKQIRILKAGIQEIQMKNEEPEIRYGKDGSKYVFYDTQNRATSLEEVADYLGIDLEKHEYEHIEPIYWDVTSWRKTEEGQPYAETVRNWRLKGKFKPSYIALDENFLRQELFEELKQKSPTVKLKHDKKTSPDYNDVLLEINIPDLHLGKLSWEPEVGESYDLKIAREIYENTIDKFIERSKHLNIEKILLVAGSDFFNVDNHLNTTYNNTPQDEDTRWQKTFKTGVNLMVEQIKKLSEIAPVEVKMIRGNHDSTRSYYLGSVLEAYFDNNKNIEIDNSPKLRKFYQYGQCGIGFAHGDKIKESSFNQIFAVEAPDIWANTKYRSFHLGDKHHKSVKNQSVIVKNNDNTTKEYRGCVVRIIPSLTSLDEYHYKSGYVGTIKGAEAFVWKKDEGLIQTIAVNL